MCAEHRGDRRKPFRHVIRIEMGERQGHRAASALDLARDAAGDDVARRQIARRMVRGHERLAARVDQPRAFSAQRLGNEKSRGARHVERRGMELDELEIGDARTRVVGERDAVARRHDRIGRLAKYLAGAAGGEQRRRRAHFVRRSGGVNVTNAGHAAVLRRRAPSPARDRSSRSTAAPARAPTRRGRSRGRWHRRRAARAARCGPLRGRAPDGPPASRSKRAPQAISSRT